MTRRGRRREREAPGPPGFLVVDKPRGWTSHDVVDAARRWLGTRRVGHLGTLDPLATGVLPLAVREATKLVPFVAAGDKAYEGSIRLGEETDTLDAEGRVLRRHAGSFPDETALRSVLAEFVGEIDQIPPMFSAVKRGGVPLHRLAREGRVVEREPKRVRIFHFELLKYEPPDLEVAVVCSQGTYVRTLAADVGAQLGCGAHLAGLRRTRSGPFELSQAASVENLAGEAERGELEARVIPPVNVLGFPVLQLTSDEERSVGHGGEITATGPLIPPGERLAALNGAGNLLAVLEVRPGRRLKPLRVLRSLAPPG